MCCNGSVRYASEGIKSLQNHSETSTHNNNNTQKILKYLEFAFTFSSIIFTSSEVLIDRTVDLITRKCRAEALITSFITEHLLSLASAPELLQLIKILSSNLSALDSLQMSHTTAAYKLAKTIKKEQSLFRRLFLLNVDESTNNAQESILSIMV